MRSDAPLGGEAGFTLIEVVVAMVILAVGLLGLEALGIGAARSIALAERQSGYASIATDSLESALLQLREGVVPRQFCRNDLRLGDRLSRRVEVPAPTLPGTARVTVRVIPNPDSYNAPANTFEISSTLYLPGVPLGSPAGAPCS